MTFKDIASIKSDSGRNDFKVIVKGVMCEEDALAVLEAGADGIWISNGSHLKPVSSPSTIDVLPSIAKSVKFHHPHAEIFIDSGIRKGTDVMKCLAHGADAVFISRPIMWGLHYKGEEGVKSLVVMLNEELKLAMALTHCFSI